MTLTQHTLESILQEIERTDEARFAAANPGVFLVAMGVLTAEEIDARNAALERGTTLPLQLDEHPRHDLQRSHPLAGQVFRLLPGGEPVQVGRAASCVLCVPEDSVSEVHCQLSPSAGGLVVVDLESTNGTQVSGVRARAGEPELVSDGELLTVGRYSFQCLTAATLHSTLSAIRVLGG